MPGVETETVLAGRYRIVRPLGEGGMGSVYLARQLGLDRLVAIKTLRPMHARYGELVPRLRREARAVQRLTHPNTVRIYDFGETSGVLFLVMEYLEGRTLEAELVSMGAMPAERVTHITRQVLKSLAEAHAQGVIHRDIKPSNIMLCKQVGEPDFVKVLDFGLASLAADTSTPATLTGETLGTPHYMSPEQVRGRVVDGRADLYALGLTVYELLTGNRAYDGGTAYEVALKHISGPPVLLPAEMASTRLGRLIRRATARSPDDRYQTAVEMLSDLTGETLVGLQVARVTTGGEAVADEDELDEEPTGDPVRVDAPGRGLSRLSRRPRWALVVAVGLAVAIAAVGLGVSAGGRAPRHPATAMAAVPPVPEVTAPAASGPEAPVPAAPPATPEKPIAAAPERASPTQSVLRVESTPAGATVLLAGQELCRTPCRESLPAAGGTEPLEVRLDGHQTFTAQVDLSHDVSLPLVLELLPAPPPVPQPADEPPAAVAHAVRRTHADARRSSPEPEARQAAGAEPSAGAGTSADSTAAQLPAAPAGPTQIPVDF